MNDIDEIIGRANLYQLQSFLLTGCDVIEEKNLKTYDQQLQEATDSVINAIEKLPISGEEQIKTIEIFLDAEIIIEQIYTEVGLRCGAKLLLQLLTGRN